MKAFDRRGLWWLPGHEDQRIPGGLTFSRDEGLRLDVEGAWASGQPAVRRFGSLVAGKDASQAGQPVILGLAPDKPLTLVECTHLRWERSGTGLETHRFRPAVVFIGAHFPARDRMKFRKVEIGCTNLAQWVGLSGFTPTRHQGASLPYEVRYERPEEPRAELDEGTVSVAFGFTAAGDWKNRVTLDQSVAFAAEAKEEMPLFAGLAEDDEAPARLNLADTFIRPLTHLLALATLGNTALEGLTVYATAAKEAAEPRLMPVEVVYEVAKPWAGPAREIDERDLLFRLSDVTQPFPDIVRRWFSFGQTLGLDMACSLFFSAHADMYLNQRFLSIAQAAELYHRIRHSPREPSENALSRIRRIIGQVHDEADRCWLTTELEHSHEPNLRRRIRDLVAFAGDAISPLITDPKRFANEVVGTRNYYTHYTHESRRQAITESAQLYRLTETLSFLMRTCFLTELGMSSADCARILSANRRFNYLARQSRGEG